MQGTDGSCLGLFFPGFVFFRQLVQAHIAPVAALGDLPGLHCCQDSAALFLDVGAADEAALAQVGPELPEGPVQRVLIQRLAALLIVKGGWYGGRGPAFR